MKFSDGEKEISDYWKKYYGELGVPVPAGQPVTNPGQLAKSEKLKYISASLSFNLLRFLKESYIIYSL